MFTEVPRFITYKVLSSVAGIANMRYTQVMPGYPTVYRLRVQGVRPADSAAGAHFDTAQQAPESDRVLYFFDGHGAAVLALGCTKEGAVEAADIDRALRYRAMYLSAPTKHVVDWP